MIRLFLAALGIVLLAIGCTDNSASVKATPEGMAMHEAALAEHIRVLASDEFEGRGLATKGEELTVQYIASQFKKFGLQPGFGNSYFQAVPLVRVQTEPDARLVVATEAARLDLSYGSDMIVWTKRTDEVRQVVDSELVFAGYGIVAPEYGWDDYAKIDVTGKTVLVLINDPGFATDDPELFSGRSMTYYGRWTYKIEEAARQGARAVLMIHQTEPAAYGWDVVVNSWSGPQYDLDRGGRDLDTVAIEGWVTYAAAARVLEAAGADIDLLARRAGKGGFRAVTLQASVNISLQSQIDRMVSQNVGALIPGTSRPDESILFSAHWDHLGIDDDLVGDKIFNGAKDNATGVAALLEIARVAAAGERSLERSLFFVAFTAEEAVLLGSLYFAGNSPLPLERMAGVLNMDVMNVWGPTHDVQVRGFGSSQLEEYLAEAARSQGRVVVADPFPEKGYYYRSDHFSLARFGVPGLHVRSGTDHAQHGDQWGRTRDREYVSDRYHKPGDEFDDRWDLSGAVQDAELYLKIALRLANERTYPQWNDGNEFEAIRDKTASSRAQ
jgi:Zn-dependent M28 family amino/carboxypeptidase